MARTYPSLPFGHRLLHDTLRDFAHLQPDPKTLDPSHGFIDVSFRDMDCMTGALAG